MVCGEKSNGEKYPILKKISLEIGENTFSCFALGDKYFNANLMSPRAINLICKNFVLFVSNLNLFFWL